MAAVAAAWAKAVGGDAPSPQLGCYENDNSQSGWPTPFNRNSDVFPCNFPGDPVFQPVKAKKNMPRHNEARQASVGTNPVRPGQQDFRN
jgi:hypothetical protein